MAFPISKTNIYFKIAIIAIIMLVLLIPATMVLGLVQEREYVQENAIQEVSSKWGNAQTLVGPYLTVPYDEMKTRWNAKDSIQETYAVRRYAHFLPEQLKTESILAPETRYRGIYEVVVYNSDVTMTGSFENLDFRKLDIDPKLAYFDKATVNLGITDLKGIEKQLVIDWNGNQSSFNPGLTTQDLATSGINAPVTVGPEKDRAYSFTAALELKGSQSVQVAPVGRTTDVFIKSDWPTPSFSGTYLPDDREITETGFDAHWNILHLNRNYPQQWTGSQYNVASSLFGTDLLLPVDNYKKTYRVAKYAILFLVLTFLTFFFVEVMRKVFIHPIQYLLVGLALIVFYVLLLSFSEHMLFNIAYALAATLTLLLISLYTAAILKNFRLGALLFGILLLLYTFIFAIIQLEDYALLVGSIGMFLVLTLVMYMSRKIDWYNLSLDNGASDKEVT